MPGHKSSTKKTLFLTDLTWHNLENFDLSPGKGYGTLRYLSFN